MPKFQPGQSGNPAGRRPGTGKIAQLRKTIERDVPEILQAMTKAAKDGDTTAARLLLERTVPALRPADTPVKVAVGGSLTEAGESILQAVGAGEITPDQAGKLLQGLGAQARVEEIVDMKTRLEAVERVLRSREKPK
jgi:hypothetical protein